MAVSCLNSFSPTTLVLMADGKTEPISLVKTGDTVESADPTTGKLTGGRKVVAALVHRDSNLIDVTVRDVHGRLSTLHTTTEHLFWDATAHSWVQADQLVPNHALQSADNAKAYVAAVRLTSGAALRYNLTVSQLHTYYVLAGTTPVLVHNTDCGPVDYGSTKLSQAVQKARVAQGNTGNNYAAAQLTDPVTGEDMGIVVARSAGKVHAEQGIVQALQGGMLPGIDESYITEMYSEFQPCATRCSKILGGLPNLQGTSWSWGWDKSGTPLGIASTEARDAAVRELFG